MAILVFLGAVCAGARVYVRRQMAMYRGDSLWRLTYSVEFDARRTGARVRVAIPADMR